MKLKRKYRDKKRSYNAGPVSIASFSQKQSKNSGFLKRFLDWIARGAAESHTGKTSCPT
jgi:hypothetical protein